jgi:hypothetical protein
MCGILLVAQPLNVICFLRRTVCPGAVMLRPFTTILALCLCSSALGADVVSFEIYGTTLDGTRYLISRGARSYRTADLEMSEHLGTWPLGTVTAFTNAALSLDEGWQIGISLYKEPVVDGFGMWAKKSWNPFGFSWEWFYSEADGQFKKLQLDGHVKVTFSHSAGLEEVAAIEFLTDATFRYEWFPGLSDSVYVVIKRGSIFRVAP